MECPLLDKSLDCDRLLALAEEIKRMLIASVNTAKSKEP